MVLPGINEIRSAIDAELEQFTRLRARTVRRRMRNPCDRAYPLSQGLPVSDDAPVNGRDLYRDAESEVLDG